MHSDKDLNSNSPKRNNRVISINGKFYAHADTIEKIPVLELITPQHYPASVPNLLDIAVIRNSRQPVSPPATRGLVGSQANIKDNSRLGQTRKARYHMTNFKDNNPKKRSTKQSKHLKKTITKLQISKRKEIQQAPRNFKKQEQPGTKTTRISPMH